MKRSIPFLALLALAALVPVAAIAASKVNKVTGGGQIVKVDANGDPVRGAWTQIAFTAQNLAPTGEAAKGQVQYNDKQGTKVHGVVDCLVVTPATPDDPAAEGDQSEPATAVIGGTDRRNNTQRFRVYVVDNGQGSAAESDLVAFESVAADDSRGPCEAADDSFDELPALGRGNAKIHKTSQSSGNGKQGGGSSGGGGGGSAPASLGLLG